jgi:patatin-like phospholipase/acyl hydrolase
VRILAIDGGGIRGLIPALVLAELERLSGQPVCRLFDLIAGTSTGAILALGLTKPGCGGAPAYSAGQLAAFYETEGPRIFRRPLLASLRSLGRLREEKYPSSGLEEALDRCFGQAYLRETLCEVLVTGYETERRIPFFFKSRNARTKPGYDFPMRLVARAACAAPTYFEPFRLVADRTHEYYSLIDGGVYANNPALCAYVEAKAAFPDHKDAVVVSLGTGELTRPLLFGEVRSWGLAGWARRILHVVQDGVSATVDYQLRQLLPPERDGTRRYWRFQARLAEGQEALDDASRDNLRGLKLLAEALIRDRAAELEQLARMLSP